MIMHIEGPVEDVKMFRKEIATDIDHREFTVGAVAEKRPGLFEHEEFGSSPFVEFLIHFSADIAAVAAVTSVGAIREKAKRWPRLRISIEHPKAEDSDHPVTAESNDEPK